jgi:CHASE2 domain-containing sensor protein
MQRLEIRFRYVLEDDIVDELIETIRRVGSSTVLLDFVREQPVQSLWWRAGGIGPDEPNCAAELRE